MKVKDVLNVLFIAGFFGIFIFGIVKCSIDESVEARKVKDFNGVGYISGSDLVTLPLETFSDNNSQQLSGCFVLGSGNISSDSKMIYRVIVKFPNGCMRSYDLKTRYIDVYLKYGEKATIKCTANFLMDKGTTLPITITIPHGSIQYDNILDGK